MLFPVVVVNSVLLGEAMSSVDSVTVDDAVKFSSSVNLGTSSLKALPKEDAGSLER